MVGGRVAAVGDFNPPKITNCPNAPLVLPNTPGQAYASLAWRYVCKLIEVAAMGGDLPLCFVLLVDPRPNITDGESETPFLRAVVSIPAGFESLLLYFPVGQYVLTLSVEDVS